jgi:hypothetical protein
VDLYTATLGRFVITFFHIPRQRSWNSSIHVETHPYLELNLKTFFVRRKKEFPILCTVASCIVLSCYSGLDSWSRLVRWPLSVKVRRNMYGSYTVTPVAVLHGSYRKSLPWIILHGNLQFKTFFLRAWSTTPSNVLHAFSGARSDRHCLVCSRWHSQCSPQGVCEDGPPIFFSIWPIIAF